MCHMQSSASSKLASGRQFVSLASRVAEVAKARGIPRAQVALAWLLAKPVITVPIVGATKLHHLDRRPCGLPRPVSRTVVGERRRFQYGCLCSPNLASAARALADSRE